MMQFESERVSSSFDVFNLFQYESEWYLKRGHDKQISKSGKFDEPHE